MPRRFAEGTSVPIERSKSEIERLLRKHGANGFLTAWDERQGASLVQFRLDERMVKMTVDDPERDDFAETAAGRERTEAQLSAAIEQETRRRWRSTLLVIKAKLELIEGGGSTAEREFMADLLLPDGSTLGEHMGPKLEAAYKGGKMPTLMLPKG